MDIKREIDLQDKTVSDTIKHLSEQIRNKKTHIAAFQQQLDPINKKLNEAITRHDKAKDRHTGKESILDNLKREHDEKKKNLARITALLEMRKSIETFDKEHIETKIEILQETEQKLREDIRELERLHLLGDEKTQVYEKTLQELEDIKSQHDNLVNSQIKYTGIMRMIINLLKDLGFMKENPEIQYLGDHIDYLERKLTTLEPEYIAKDKHVTISKKIDEISLNIQQLQPFAELPEKKKQLKQDIHSLENIIQATNHELTTLKTDIDEAEQAILVAIEQKQVLKEKDSGDIDQQITELNHSEKLIKILFDPTRTDAKNTLKNTLIELYESYTKPHNHRGTRLFQQTNASDTQKSLLAISRLLGAIKTFMEHTGSEEGEKTAEYTTLLNLSTELGKLQRLGETNSAAHRGGILINIQSQIEKLPIDNPLKSASGLMSSLMPPVEQASLFKRKKT